MAGKIGAKFEKNDLYFQKLHEKFGKFSSEHSKASKLGLSWNTYIQSRKLMRLNFTGKLCVMTTKNDGKFRE